jgi:hypothetical protein
MQYRCKGLYPLKTVECTVLSGYSTHVQNVNVQCCRIIAR